MQTLCSNMKMRPLDFKAFLLFHSSTHSFNRSWLTAYYVPGTVLKQRSQKFLSLWSLYFSGGHKRNKINNMYYVVYNIVYVYMYVKCNTHCICIYIHIYMYNIHTHYSDLRSGKNLQQRVLTPGSFGCTFPKGLLQGAREATVFLTCCGNQEVDCEPCGSCRLS